MTDMQNIIKKFMYVISCLFRRQFFGFVKGHNYLSKESLYIIQKLVGKSSHEIIQKFDTEFAAQIGKGQTVSFAAGRMGFFALLQSLGIGEGD